ncbi:MAG: glutamate--tRNA ligase [Candidatus Terrybacteria bacterium RIFCSPLOWO2_01_FULL_44_24]|uniref:Glutamate--tRNA ligase n=1 Tax=Candidatus Terrybacteria bacterium RIFCSPHIGHO2_01_FULL_43_35 TaxID=1802361 RepID=A0A1G2PC33_9BACT|nr:MAG: glutamate--tRNA ligase [Candidatus Terrybacteria bacterium RIFCSPHIGHO2_01_FULL_43_35]OHA49666.1 MAG: glutamate--tRNA ligase [Candidatus Terrybacteria bacterium RIFCSPHIGHO2_02_FULL_43_14]OHA51331.1 MAG: glutamate--tRNA ligase [Candidatus Terrybacteria bacterium RIFCSPLOWO2_01_FULL_44_24]
METGKKVRVRYAPSPTGMMHVGNFRTALYNFLFARKHKGVFYIRIEDTDQSRFVEGGAENILRTLVAMGIEHDEGPFLKNDHIEQKGDFGPYLQSQRLIIYQQSANQLIASGKAYPCFCVPERLEKLRQEQEGAKIPTGYDRLCRKLGAEEIEKRQTAGEKFVVRFKMPQGDETTFEDMIRGKISFQNKLLDDYVLLKSDGYPTYHLANIIDDYLMGTTHVIRGEEWLPSTPKHVLLYKAFDWQVPYFAHLPLLLNPDRSKLSKRQGDVAVEDYLAKGYYPEAVLNFVALLGWNPGTEQEIFSLDDLTKEFSIERIHKSGAIFDHNKLNWLDDYYHKHKENRWLTPKDVDLRRELIKEFIPAHIISNANAATAMLGMIEQRLHGPSDIPHIPELFSFLENTPPYDSTLLLWKKMKSLAEAKTALIKIKEIISHINENDWDERIEIDVMDLAQKYGDRGAVLWPMRVALSGLDKSPGPVEIAKSLGRKETLKRIDEAVAKIN